jgi:hypothetical protein
MLSSTPTPSSAQSLEQRLESLQRWDRQGRPGLDPQNPIARQRYRREWEERRQREANPRTREEECWLRFKTPEAIEYCIRVR